MRYLSIVAIVSVLLASCKEVPVDIDFGIVKPYDTTYVDGSATVADPRNVMIEEFTGVKCVNCPTGHATLAAIKTQVGARVVIVSIQPDKLPSLTLPYGGGLTQHDNTTTNGGDIFDFLGGTGSLPAASIDRVPVNGAILQTATNTWSNAVNNRLQVTSPVNMTLTASYDSAKRQVVIRVKATYTEAVTKQQYLTVVIKEDGVVDAQEDHAGIDTFYVHNNLFRDVITPAAGQRILQSFPTIEKGRVYESVIIYTVNNAWKPEHCSIVANVSNNDNGDKEVEQAAEVKLLP